MPVLQLSSFLMSWPRAAKGVSQESVPLNGLQSWRQLQCQVWECLVVLFWPPGSHVALCQRQLGGWQAGGARCSLWPSPRMAGSAWGGGSISWADYWAVVDYTINPARMSCATRYLDFAVRVVSNWQVTFFF